MTLRLSSHRRWFVGEPLQTLTFSTQSVGLDHLGNVGVELEALRSAPVSSLNLLFFLFFLLLLETFFAFDFFWVLERVSLRFGLRERPVACVPKDSCPCSHGVPQPRPSGRAEGGEGIRKQVTLPAEHSCGLYLRSLCVVMGEILAAANQTMTPLLTYSHMNLQLMHACHDV